jgi:calcium-dependent protein kinase
VHRDLKLENILFETKEFKTLKLIDFGLSTRIEAGKTLKLKVGSPYYVAPEILCSEDYDEKCDVWSVGVIMYILLCGHPPFEGKTELEIYEKAAKGSYTFKSIPIFCLLFLLRVRMEEYIKGGYLSDTLNAHRQPKIKGFGSSGPRSPMV